MSNVYWVEKCRADFDKMSNEVFETPELKRYFASPLTWAGDRIHSGMIRHYFVPNRRDCWAYVMAAAPIDVKQVIWHHEEDELIPDRTPIGLAHGSRDRDSQEVRGDQDKPEILPGVKVACYAWILIAKDHPWLEGLAASHILARINDPTVIKGPALAQRGMNQRVKDLGVKIEELPPSARVHLEADTVHTNLTWSPFERYVTDEGTYGQAIRGARESLECFRVYAGSVGDAMAAARNQ